MVWVAFGYGYDVGFGWCSYDCLVLVCGVFLWLYLACGFGLLLVVRLLFCFWLVGAVDTIACGRLLIVWYLFVGFCCFVWFGIFLQWLLYCVVNSVVLI